VRYIPTDLYLSRGLYGQRKWNHFDLFESAPGWWFLEVGSWTLQVEFAKCKAAPASH
jgi:hypothetical protein